MKRGFQCLRVIRLKSFCTQGTKKNKGEERHETLSDKLVIMSFEKPGGKRFFAHDKCAFKTARLAGGRKKLPAIFSGGGARKTIRCERGVPKF